MTLENGTHSTDEPPPPTSYFYLDLSRMLGWGGGGGGTGMEGRRALPRTVFLKPVGIYTEQSPAVRYCGCRNEESPGGRESRAIKVSPLLKTWSRNIALYNMLYLLPEHVAY